MKVYSCEYKAREFHEFFADDVTPEDVEQLLVLANHNPRDLWHIFNALFHKQYAINPNSSLFTKEAFIGALADFVTNFNYYEYYLLKLPDAEFTANQLNFCAGTGSSTNNFIGSMQALGLIVRTDSKVGTGIVYRINDPKVIYAIRMGLRIARTQ